MNILVVSQSKNLIGGANRSLFDVIEMLSKKYHHKCTVIVPGEGEFTKALKNNGYNVIEFNYLQNTFIHLHDFFDVYRTFKATIKDIQNIIYAKKAAVTLSKKEIYFDKVYINDTSNTFGYYLAKQLHLPYVWHFRNYNIDTKRYMLIEKRLRKGTDGICIAISNAMREFMISTRKISPESIHTIHNGVLNHNKEIMFPWHDRNINNEYHCVQCGMLMEIKDQITSIKAVKILKDKGYFVFLHLAGPSTFTRGESYKNILEKLVKQLNIEDRVVFEGNVEDMALFRKKMSFELMCSKAEPFGRVTVEGMQAGLVVIGSNTGATPEIIIDGFNGLLFKQGSDLDLAEKIQYIINNKFLGDKIALNAFDFTKTHFTIEENVKAIDTILRKGN